MVGTMPRDIDDPLQGAPAARWWPEERAIEVSGSDAESWLQRMVPTDVLQVEPGSSARSMLLERTGKLRWLLRVARTAEPPRHWLLVEQGAAEAVRSHLDRFVVMEEVALGLPEGSDPWGVLALTGPEALERARAVATEVGGLQWLRAARLAPQDAELIGPLDRLQEADRLLSRLGVPSLEPERLALARVLAPDPHLGADITPRELPLEAGLRPAVSFSKGCYTGQEAVNKMAHRGKPRRLLVRLRLRGEAPLPEPGARITLPNEPERPLGRLGTVAPLPEGSGVLALGVVRREAAEQPGGTLRVEAWSARIEGPVDALP